ncbi:MAG: methionyl-tRNA formyltransferase [Verrucomicrobia bacterium]|jgi:methionyl-tRNA formyltransferase|nr:methionyl-tRNA formyltransferase [Verrucomicrobiota bacterium]MBT7698775.1 methionyl-tRNA formyltransferase [Verrucomicrobiota bacterium]
MRALFMGSAPLSCASLDVVLEQCEVVGVVSQPDRPRGRNRKVCAGAITAHATGRVGTILTPERVNTPESLAAVAALQPDVIVVVAYGQILHQPLLDLPALGCINVHTSLLPKYRGAAPIQWAIAHGETETGVTTMYMDAGMDTGDIILQEALSIGPDETAAELHDRLAVTGAALLGKTLHGLASGDVPRHPQDSTVASMAPLLSKADGRIDWMRTAADIHNRVRGFNPWPGSSCGTAAGKRLKLWRVAPAAAVGEGVPGTVVAVEEGYPVIATGAGGIRLLEVQPEGGKVMDGRAYMRGHRLAPGDRLE